MKLLFDKNELPDTRRLQDARLTWLKDLGAEKYRNLPSMNLKRVWLRKWHCCV